MLRLAAQWNIDAKDIIAVGDNDNDVSMIQIAGLGVAMDDGSEPLKRCADLIIGSNDEDSIAAFIESHILAHNKAANS